jgi:CBS-domain-containing membrane protein
LNEPDFELAALLVHAFVAIEVTVEEAARELTRSDIGAVAVLDGDKVKGMFTEDDLLRAVFPGYLSELTHTSFVQRDSLLAPHLEQAAATPVSEFMAKPELVPLPTSALDIAQRFLHTEATALVATRDGSFAGLIDQAQFCTAILRRYGWQL